MGTSSFYHQSAMRPKSTRISLLSSLSFLSLVPVFWPTIRIADFTVFDLLSIPTIAIIFATTAPTNNHAYKVYRDTLIGIGILALGGVISTVMTTDPWSHCLRVIFLIVAFIQMAMLSYGIISRDILYPSTIIGALTISGLLSSAVALLQGRFGLLLGLIPETEYTEGFVQDWTRMTGLAEHPIEAGLTIGYAAICALYFTGAARWFTVPAAVFMLSSFAFTSSLTAIFGAGGALILLLILSKRFTELAFWLAILIPGAVISYQISPLLSDRIENLLLSGTDYETLQDRLTQYNVVISKSDFTSTIFGHGYAPRDLPLGLDIHNGMLQALYHFGLLGIISQVVFLGAIAIPVLKSSSSRCRNVLISLLVIFISGYLTGPIFARRSIWLPLFLVASLVASSSSRTAGELR